MKLTMKCDNRKKNYVTWNLIEKEENLWFSVANKNGICKISLKDNKAEIVNCFCREDLMRQLLYADVDILENYIVFAPFGAKEIAIYDMNTEEIKYFSLINDLNKYKGTNKQYAKFSNLFKWKNYVYILGYSYPVIIKIDIHTKKIKYISDFANKIEQKIEQDEERGFFTEGYFIKNEKVYLPIGCLSGILELDLNSDCSRIIKLRCSLDGIGALALDENEMVWLVGRGKINNRLVKWDMLGNLYFEWEIPNIDKNCWDPFHTIICLKDRVILWPSSAKRICYLDLSKKIIKELDQLEVDEDTCLNFPWTTLAPIKLFNKVIFISGKNSKWYEMNIENFTVSEFIIDWTLVDSFYYDKELEKREVITEEIVPLQYFIKNVNVKEEKLSVKQELGEKIYENM